MPAISTALSGGENAFAGDFGNMRGSPDTSFASCTLWLFRYRFAHHFPHNGCKFIRCLRRRRVYLRKLLTAQISHLTRTNPLPHAIWPSSPSTVIHRVWRPYRSHASHHKTHVRLRVFHYGDMARDVNVLIHESQEPCSQQLADFLGCEFVEARDILPKHVMDVRCSGCRLIVKNGVFLPEWVIGLQRQGEQSRYGTSYREGWMAGDFRNVSWIVGQKPVRSKYGEILPLTGNY